MTLIVTLAAMSFVTMMAVLLFTMTRDDMAIAGNYRRHVVAKQAARSGLNHFTKLVVDSVKQVAGTFFHCTGGVAVV